jgi:hypothetical protein
MAALPDDTVAIMNNEELHLVIFVGYN